MNFRYTLAFLLALIDRKKKFILLVIILSCLALLAYSYYVKFFVRPGITIGMVGTHLEENLPDQVTRFISESLITTDQSGMPLTNMVKSWESDKEAKRYIFKLKDNLAWSNGEKIKASDIQIGLPDVIANYPDDNTIELNLTESFSPLPSLLTKPALRKESRIGTGPYKIKKIQKDQIFIKRIHLTSSDRNLPNIQINFYPNEKIAKNALNLGEVSALLGVMEISDTLNQKTLAHTSKTNFQQVVTVFYNTRDPVLSDENFRLALSFAAPSMKGEVEAKTSIPPKSWAFNPNVKDFLDNAEMAKTYFKKVQKGKEDTITLTATSSLKEVGEKVVESWKKMGIKAVLRVESGIPQNFQALLISQNIPVDPDQYSLWHSTQKETNISKFSDQTASPRIDKDLEDGRKITDLEERKAKYYDFQKILLDNAPATFLYFPKFNVVYRKKVEKELFKVLPMQFPHLFSD